MQAILTRYHGATDTKQARVTAWCQAKRIIRNWDDGLDIDGNHDATAKELAESLGWLEYSTLHGGGLPDGSGNCYVLIPKRRRRG